MQLLDNILDIVNRGLEISLTLTGPLSLLLYLGLMGVVYLAYYKRGGRLASFAHLMGGVFFFFIVWNHPDYAWYKARPWNGGYAYALVMVMTYVYLPMKIAIFITEIVRGALGIEPPKPRRRRFRRPRND
ncbi:hypothetical protein [Desulfocurvus sp. DL9XJH121]